MRCSPAILILAPGTNSWSGPQAHRRCCKHIHVQNPAGFVSFGLPIGDVPSMKRDIPVIVGRISADLFQADLEVLRRRMTGDVAPDFSEALYRSAVR